MALDLGKLSDESHKIRDALLEFTHSKRFPILFIGDDYIGGLEDLQNVVKTGQLRKRLSDSKF